MVHADATVRTKPWCDASSRCSDHSSLKPALTNALKTKLSMHLLHVGRCRGRCRSSNQRTWKAGETDRPVSRSRSASRTPLSTYNLQMAFRSRSLWILITGSCLSLITSATGCDGGEENDDEGADAGDGDGDGDGNGDGDGDGDSPNGFCTGDKACQATNQVCDVGRNVCVDCIIDDDCDDEDICSQSKCQATTPCKTSKECSLEQVCAEDLGRCVDCEQNADCADDEVCINTVCLPRCDSDKDCADADQVCNVELSACQDCLNHSDCDELAYCSSSGACLEDTCEAGAATCIDGNLSTCKLSGDGFDTTTCENGCSSNNKKCATGGDCNQGDEGCACYPNNTCNGSLSCLSNLCVDAGGGSGGQSGSGGNASSGGASGAGGAASGGAAAGTGGAMPGECLGIDPFQAGAGNKYALNAQVTDICNGGRPCSDGGGITGLRYEFKCLDQHNCGSEAPGTTYWAQPPWQLVAECTD